MVDPKPLLKGFGALADVVGQIATDKAVNARRERPRPLDITKGELVRVVIDPATGAGEATVPRTAQAALPAGSELSFGQNPGYLSWSIANHRLRVQFYVNGASGTMDFWVF